MTSNKNTARALTVLGIILVLYCALVFVILFERGSVFWLSFVFTLIAILAQIYILKIAFCHGESLKSKFYGFPIAKVGAIYLAVQLVLGLIFMALGKWIPVWVAAPVYILILALSAIGIIATDAARDEVERQETQKKIDTSFMDNLYLEVSGLATQCGEPEVKKTLEKLAEEIRFSDPVSAEGVLSIENEITEAAGSPQKALADKDTAKLAELALQIKNKLQARNRLVKQSK